MFITVRVRNKYKKKWNGNDMNGNTKRTIIKIRLPNINQKIKLFFIYWRLQKLIISISIPFNGILISDPNCNIINS